MRKLARGGGDGAEAGDGAAPLIAVVSEHPLLNRAGVRMQPGPNGELYCGRRLGTGIIPGSDGQCGPNNGPQCPDCRTGVDTSQQIKLNSLGMIMQPGIGKGAKLLYCCRMVKPGVRCGPLANAPCAECAAGPDPTQPVCKNRAGVVMARGRGRAHDLWYCGRVLGASAIPGSDGQCGPTNGPQCADCDMSYPAVESRVSRYKYTSWF